MRKLVVVAFLSLDGVYQAPGHPDEDRAGGFEHGGWQMPYFDEVMGESAAEGIAATDAQLFGRTTFDKMAAYWPNAPEDDPFAQHLNAVQKYVASTTLTDPGWQPTTVIRDVPTEVAALKAQEGGTITVLGSGQLVRTLTAHDLVDEYSLAVFPLTLGGGKRMFADDGVLRGCAWSTRSRRLRVGSCSPTVRIGERRRAPRGGYQGRATSVGGLDLLVFSGRCSKGQHTKGGVQMLHRSFLAGLVVVLVASLPGWAAADYRDTYRDPNDRPPVETDPDLRSTSRRVVTGNGGRVLIVSVRAYEEFEVAWNITTRLDSRDGPRRDFVMYIYDADQSGRGCRFYPAGQSGGFIRGRFTQVADRVACRVDLSLVDATKRIRWKLSSITEWKGGQDDHAPNGGGWYS